MSRFQIVAAEAVAFVILLAQTVAAQDREYIDALERAQQQQPAHIGSSSRIAPAQEPGTPMTLQGRIIKPDGNAAAGTIVFAYHTDGAGLYDRSDAGAHSWRLKGWARADEQGRFTFETIRPGAYPDRRTPAHVHFTAFTPSGERYHAGELKFEDDPLVPQREREASRRAGEVGEVRAVRRERGVESVEFTLRIDLAQRF
ncbi:MAG TPA: hypothetical protein VK993_03050 [Chthoniobacterales bacterium]|nr:hypothetical protein [Chthoniobacterales bacterium]